MEKFGIFELLDALSQITAGTDEQNTPYTSEKGRSEEHTSELQSQR